jgi:hypothetical protein
LVSVFKQFGFQMVSFITVKWSEPEWKSNSHSMSSPVFKLPCKNHNILSNFQMVTTCPVLDWLVPAEIDPSNTILVQFSDISCA